jgi:hypothetical protein
MRPSCLRLLRLGILIVLASAPPATGQAAEKLPLRPDKPGVWREATYFNRSTQFSCPDRQPRTPLCAIELVFVCKVRWYDDDLCARVKPFTEADRKAWEGRMPGGSPNTVYRYRIEKIRFVRKSDIKRDPSRNLGPDPDPEKLRVGDLLVTVRSLTCGGWGPKPCAHERHALKQGYRLRKIEGLWQWLWWDERFLGAE